MFRETTARSGPFADRRRHVLAAVSDRNCATVGELADLLAARIDDDREAAATRHEVALVHTHLPRLDSAGLVEFDRERGTVRARVDTLEAVDEWYRDHDGGRGDGSPSRTDPHAPGRWRDRRRTIRAILSRHDPGDRTTLSVLTVAVAVSERGPAAADLGPVRTTLHHVHLPNLDAAGVVDYDPEATAVTCRRVGSGTGAGGHAETAPDGSDARRRSEDDAVWTVSGREDVRERQRAVRSRRRIARRRGDGPGDGDRRLSRPPA
jgi:hypothetical protein